MTKNEVFALSIAVTVICAICSIVWIVDGSYQYSKGRSMMPIMTIMGLFLVWETGKEAGFFKGKVEARDEEQRYKSHFNRSLRFLGLMVLADIAVGTILPLPGEAVLVCLL